METSPLICRAEMTPSVGAENQKLVATYED